MNINGVKMSDVANYVVARAEEIVANVIEQIEYAGLKDKDLPGGIICIGGGAQLRGMLQLLGDRSKLPVRRGQLPSYIRIEDNRNPQLELIEVASVLYTGATNNNAECLAVPQREELPINGETASDPLDEPEEPKRKRGADKKPKKKGPSFFERMSGKLSGFFTGNDDDDDDIII